jgi:hypothetical protein
MIYTHQTHPFPRLIFYRETPDVLAKCVWHIHRSARVPSDLSLEATTKLNSQEESI